MARLREPQESSLHRYTSCSRVSTCKTHNLQPVIPQKPLCRLCLRPIDDLASLQRLRTAFHAYTTTCGSNPKHSTIPPLRFLSIRRIVLSDQAPWRVFSSITNFESMRGSFRKYSKYWCWRLISDGGVRVQYKDQYKTSSIFIASYTLNLHIIFELYIYTVHISVLVTSNLMDGRCCMQSGLICACVHFRCTPALAVLVLPHWTSPIITCHSLVTLSSYEHIVASMRLQ